MLKLLPLITAAVTAFIVFPALYAFAGYTLFTRILASSSLATVACFFAIAMLVIGVLEFLRFAATDRIDDRPWSHFLMNLLFYHAGAGIAVLIGYLIAGLLRADPPWTAALGLVFGVFVAASPVKNGFPVGGPPADLMHTLRGRALRSRKQVERQIRRHESDPGLTWGGQQIPTDAATRHFLVVGTTGSGKTVTLQLLMEQVLRDIRPGSNRRAVLFDAKTDLVSLLQNFRLPCPVHILNPFDDRGVAWDLAADMTDPGDAFQLAQMLVPKTGKESQPFFPDAAVTVLSALVETFQTFAPRSWTLRDVLCGASLDKSDLAKICNELPHVAMTLNPVMEANEFPSVRVSIPVTLRPFYPIAAAWEQARQEGKLISLSNWNETDSILLLPNLHTQHETLLPLNRLLLRRLMDVLLSNPNNTPKRTWLFLDELAQLGRIPKFSEFLPMCRSKGIAVAIGIQELAGLFKETAYGKEEGSVIIGQCNNRAFLRTKDEATAQWAAKQIGEVERFIPYTTATYGQHPSTTDNQQFQATTHVLPSQLIDLDPNAGYYEAHGVKGAWASAYGQEFLDARLTKQGDPNFDFVKRTKPAVLQPWTAEDLKRLNLTFLGTAAPPPPKSLGPLRRIQFPKKDADAG